MLEGNMQNHSLKIHWWPSKCLSLGTLPCVLHVVLISYSTSSLLIIIISSFSLQGILVGINGCSGLRSQPVSLDYPNNISSECRQRLTPGVQLLEHTARTEFWGYYLLNDSVFRLPSLICSPPPHGVF